MSGHSKWSTIKRQKGAADAKRGQAFTKLGNAISLAVRQGNNPDPDQNFKLRLIIDKARALNMPKDNIEHAIERGMGKGKGDDLQETVYEGYGPGGVALIVEAATDNKLRTTSEVKNLFDKNNSSLGVMGAVSYLFQTKGEIVIKKNGKTLDEVFLLAADAGAEDVTEEEEEFVLSTKPEDLVRVREALSLQHVDVSSAGLMKKPINSMTIEHKDDAAKLLAFIEKLENHPDVQKVYTNASIADTLIEALSA